MEEDVSINIYRILEYVTLAHLFEKKKKKNASKFQRKLSLSNVTAYLSSTLPRLSVLNLQPENEFALFCALKSLS